MPFNFQYSFYIGWILNSSGCQFYADTGMWHHYMRHFNAQLSCLCLDHTNLHYLYCGDLLLLILAALFVVLCGCLLWLHLLMDRCDFTNRFIFFLLFIIVACLFLISVISRLMIFLFVFIDPCLDCQLTFDYYVLCSCCITFWLHRGFNFHVIPFWVHFYGVVWACIDPCGQKIDISSSEIKWGGTDPPFSGDASQGQGSGCTRRVW